MNKDIIAVVLNAVSRSLQDESKGSGRSVFFIVDDEFFEGFFHTTIGDDSLVQKKNQEGFESFCTVNSMNVFEDKNDLFEYCDDNDLPISNDDRYSYKIGEEVYAVNGNKFVTSKIDRRFIYNGAPRYVINSNEYTKFQLFKNSQSMYRYFNNQGLVVFRDDAKAAKIVCHGGGGGGMNPNGSEIMGFGGNVSSGFVPVYKSAKDSEDKITVDDVEGVFSNPEKSPMHIFLKFVQPGIDILTKFSNQTMKETSFLVEENKLLDRWESLEIELYLENGIDVPSLKKLSELGWKISRNRFYFDLKEAGCFSNKDEEFSARERLKNLSCLRLYQKYVDNDLNGNFAFVIERFISITIKERDEFRELWIKAQDELDANED